jgi:uncharacterized cupin superfamily protein
MADYTLLNLRNDVEDQAPKFGMGDGIEARFGREPLGLEKSGLSYFKVGPGYKLPFGHRHTEQEEIYVVIGGTARLKLEEEQEVELRELDAMRVPPGTMRGMAGGPEGAEIVAFGAPNTENKDIEMVRGFWG